QRAADPRGRRRTHTRQPGVDPRGGRIGRPGGLLVLRRDGRARYPLPLSRRGRDARRIAQSQRGVRRFARPVSGTAPVFPGGSGSLGSPSPERAFEEAVRRAAQACGFTIASFPVAYPPTPAQGDLASPVCFDLARTARRPPRSIAEAIASAFVPQEGIS